VEALNVAPGHRVLDVGCGTGLLADHVARIVGAEGLVVGIDPLPLRVAIAQRRQRPNLRFQIGTAFDLSEFPTGSFDAAYLHLVMHWLPDKVEPLRQLHRVVKPGALIGLTTSARECENSLAKAQAAVLSSPPFSEYADAGHAWGHRLGGDELRALLQATGFAVTSLATEATVTHWPTVDDAIAFSETISAGNLFGHVPEALRHAARRALAARLEPLRETQGIRIEGARLVAVASRC